MTYSLQVIHCTYEFIHCTGGLPPEIIHCTCENIHEVIHEVFHFSFHVAIYIIHVFSTPPFRRFSPTAILVFTRSSRPLAEGFHRLPYFEVLK